MWCSDSESDLASKINFQKSGSTLNKAKLCIVSWREKNWIFLQTFFLHAKSLQQIICHVCTEVVAALWMYYMVRTLIFLTLLSSFSHGAPIVINEYFSGNPSFQQCTLHNKEKRWINEPSYCTTVIIIIFIFSCILNLYLFFILQISPLLSFFT